MKGKIKNFLGIDNYKRIEWIDIAKSIGIMLVILGHILPMDSILKKYIYSFHMPLFFILTGIVYSYKDNESFCKIIEKQIKSILIPFFIFGLIFSDGSIKSFVFIAYGNRTTLLCAKTNSSLWFLTCLFVANLLNYISFRITHDDNKKIFVSSIISLIIGVLLINVKIKYKIPFEVDNAFVAMFFIQIGYLYKKNEVIVKKYINKITLPIIFIIHLIIFNLNNKIQYVIMADGKYGNMPLFILAAIFGSIIYIALAKIISKKLKHKMLLCFIGMNTLTIMCIHKFAIQIANKIINILNLNSILNYVLSFVLVLSICTIIIPILNKFVPELVGKKPKEIK